MDVLNRRLYYNSYTITYSIGLEGVRMNPYDAVLLYKILGNSFHSLWTMIIEDLNWDFIGDVNPDDVDEVSNFVKNDLLNIWNRTRI